MVRMPAELPATSPVSVEQLCHCRYTQTHRLSLFYWGLTISLNLLKQLEVILKLGQNIIIYFHTAIKMLFPNMIKIKKIMSYETS